MLSRIFKLQENKTTVSREIQAGLTTFAAMACVLAVSPDILPAAGMEKPALVTITALGAAVISLFTGRALTITFVSHAVAVVFFLNPPAFSRFAGRFNPDGLP